MKTKIAGLVILVAVAVTTARGQLPGLFGGGVPVFDATNFGNAIKRHLELQRQLAQLVLEYEQLVLEYEHFIYMAQKLPGLAGQRFPSTLWRFSRSANTYGTTGAWSTGINTGVGVAQGYRLATEPLNSYGATLAAVPGNQLDRVKTRYATVELADAANLHGMEVLGKQRVKAAAAEAALAKLEGATLSTEDDLNTHIAVLNKINAANMMALRAGQETNQVLVSVLEQQITDSKRKRDAEAAVINAEIAFRANALDAGMKGIKGTTQAIRSFRMP